MFAMREVRLDCGVCVLRPWRSDDLAALVHQANNRHVWLTLRDRFPHPYTIDAGRAWLDAAGATNPPTALAIEADGVVAGGIGVVPGVDVHRHTGEIGYWLGQGFWGRGIATAAVAAFVPWVGDVHALTRVFADVFANNPASARVLEKCGFTLEGRMPRHIYKAGEYLDQLVYGRLI